MPDDANNQGVAKTTQGGQGGAPSVLTDDHHTRADCALVRRAVREGWNIGPDDKEILKARLRGIIQKTEVTVPSQAGPISVEAPADANAIAAVRVMLAMDQTDQSDTHIAEKYERIDTGKHTEAVKMYESGSDTDAV